VEAQQRNTNSLLWWTRRVLALRKRWRAFGEGTMEFLQPENRKVLAFIRRYENQTMLVVANLSRFTQPVELDLTPFKDAVPVELFGRTEFPRVTEKPYFLTLGPHTALWFHLEPKFTADHQTAAGGPLRCDTIVVSQDWDEVLEGKARERLEACLVTYLQQRRWFAGKGRQIKSLQIRDTVPLPYDSTLAILTVVTVEYTQGDPEEYLLPLAFAQDKSAEALTQHSPHLLIARLERKDSKINGIIHDASGADAFCSTLLEAIARRRSFKGKDGELEATAMPAFRAIRGDSTTALAPSVGNVDQSNTSIVFGDRFFLKLFRKLDVGTNPDLEIGRFLTGKEFTGAPPVAGALEYRRSNGETLTLLRPGTNANEEIVVAKTKYEDVQPWPVSADGLGPSLQLVDLLFDLFGERAIPFI
jgi:maltose alpha-D-glucosyltransferase/alpha-amylase